MTIREQYKQHQLLWTVGIRFKPYKRDRIILRIKYLLLFPFTWLFYNLRDWRSAICILISFLLWSGTVWVPYMLGFIAGPSTPKGIAFISAASAVWLWWLGPFGSPFWLIVVLTGVLFKTIFNLITGGKKHENKTKRKSQS